MATILWLLGACGNKSEAAAASYDHIKNIEWLAGDWQSVLAGRGPSESWKKINDSTLAGKAIFVVEKDTVFSEGLNLEERNHQLLYVPTVKDQNNNQPVTFTLTSLSQTEWVFENPAHDFPQKITYKRMGNDSIVAGISGIDRGQPRTEVFAMKRVK